MPSTLRAVNNRPYWERKNTLDKLVDILSFFIHVPGIVLAVTIHEYTKAAASHMLGDPTPKNQKRLTLNPFKHLDAAGFLLLFLFRFGWGKPVETRPFAYKKRKRDALIVYTLPSVLNLLIGALLGLAARFMPASADVSDVWTGFFTNMLIAGATINIGYFFFNLIPVHPLDGAQVLSVIKPEWGMKVKLREPYLQIAMMLMLCFGLLGQFFSGFITGIIGVIY
ncbi:MAG: site-2 protease family protein [Clostridiales bacterium]|jgi:Zn-dependent protease|nr:site-2 protease family protein [Clostridiales bacterium]